VSGSRTLLVATQMVFRQTTANNNRMCQQSYTTSGNAMVFRQTTANNNRTYDFFSLLVVISFLVFLSLCRTASCDESFVFSLNVTENGNFSHMVIPVENLSMPMFSILLQINSTDNFHNFDNSDNNNHANTILDDNFVNATFTLTLYNNRTTKQVYSTGPKILIGNEAQLQWSETVNPCTADLYSSLQNRSLYFNIRSFEGQGNTVSSVLVNLTFPQTNMTLSNGTVFKPQANFIWLGQAPQQYHFIDTPADNNTVNYTLSLNLTSPQSYFTNVTIRTCSSVPNVTGNITKQFQATVPHFPGRSKVIIGLIPNENYEPTYQLTATLQKEKPISILSKTVLIIVAVIGACLMCAISGGVILFVWQKRKRQAYTLIE